jgi:hypothetical protein
LREIATVKPIDYLVIERIATAKRFLNFEIGTVGYIFDCVIP